MLLVSQTLARCVYYLYVTQGNFCSLHYFFQLFRLFKLLYKICFCFCNSSIGFDLSSAYDLVIPKHGKAIVKTDLAISIPDGTYARVGTWVILLELQFLHYLTQFCGRSDVSDNCCDVCVYVVCNCPSSSSQWFGGEELH